MKFLPNFFPHACNCNSFLLTLTLNLKPLYLYFFLKLVILLTRVNYNLPTNGLTEIYIATRGLTDFFFLLCLSLSVYVWEAPS